MSHTEALIYACDLCAQREVQLTILSNKEAMLPCRDSLLTEAGRTVEAGVRLRELRDFLAALTQLKPDLT